jgi:hypothetical protein
MNEELRNQIPGQNDGNIWVWAQKLTCMMFAMDCNEIDRHYVSYCVLSVQTVVRDE